MAKLVTLETAIGFMERNYHRWHSLALCLLLEIAIPACGGAQNTGCYQNDMSRTGPSSGMCYSSNDPRDAIVAAGLAALGWAVVGCTVNGCVPPFRCNARTKLCESIDCDENSPCPAAYECNLVTHECE